MLTQTSMSRRVVNMTAIAAVEAQIRKQREQQERNHRQREARRYQHHLAGVAPPKKR